MGTIKEPQFTRASILNYLQYLEENDHLQKVYEFLKELWEIDEISRRHAGVVSPRIAARRSTYVEAENEDIIAYLKQISS